LGLVSAVLWARQWHAAFLLKDACYTMGQVGRKRIHDFTWDTYGARVFEVYKKILDKK